MSLGAILSQFQVHDYDLYSVRVDDIFERFSWSGFRAYDIMTVVALDRPLTARSGCYSKHRRTTHTEPPCKARPRLRLRDERIKTYKTRLWLQILQYVLFSLDQFHSRIRMSYLVALLTVAGKT